MLPPYWPIQTYSRKWAAGMMIANAVDDVAGFVVAAAAVAYVAVVRDALIALLAAFY